MSKPKVGTIGWMDLTVDDAESVRDFYSSVVGWMADPVDMGDYSDFNMLDPDGKPVAGVCHQRGSNQGTPRQWIIYATVADLDASMEACEAGGGEVVHGPHSIGPDARYCVIRDPAGAAMGLYEQKD